MHLIAFDSVLGDSFRDCSPAVWSAPMGGLATSWDLRQADWRPSSDHPAMTFSCLFCPSRWETITPLAGYLEGHWSYKLWPICKWNKPRVRDLLASNNPPSKIGWSARFHGMIHGKVLEGLEPFFQIPYMNFEAATMHLGVEEPHWQAMGIIRVKEVTQVFRDLF